MGTFDFGAINRTDKCPNSLQNAKMTNDYWPKVIYMENTLFFKLVTDDVMIGNG